MLNYLLYYVSLYNEGQTMMKTVLISLALLTFSFAGFFQEGQNDASVKEQQEAQRLCTLFTEKAETYQKTMRNDELAQKTLQSYKKRASLYCQAEKK